MQIKKKQVKQKKAERKEVRNNKDNTQSTSMLKS